MLGLAEIPISRTGIGRSFYYNPSYAKAKTLFIYLFGAGEHRASCVLGKQSTTELNLRSISEDFNPPPKKKTTLGVLFSVI